VHKKPCLDFRRLFVDLDECFFNEKERSQLARLESETRGSAFAQEDNLGNLLIFAAGNHDAVYVFLRGSWGYVADLVAASRAAARRVS